MERDKSGINRVLPTYNLYIQAPNGTKMVILCGKKRAFNSTPNYLISMLKHGKNRGSDNAELYGQGQELLFDFSPRKLLEPGYVCEARHEGREELNPAEARLLFGHTLAIRVEHAREERQRNCGHRDHQGERHDELDSK